MTFMATEARDDSESRPHGTLVLKDEEKITQGAAWDPLKQPLFRAVWIATLASNLGTWMQDVGAAWLMTSLAPTPFMVSLVQAALTFPIFVLALPAGALADVVDRRKLLLAAQGWMMVAAGGLALTTYLALTTPLVLLGLTAMLGIGAALSLPAWQAIVPELVPRKQLASAISLNGVAINIARGAGPALGGVLIAVAGPELPFVLNAVSFVTVVVVLYRWRRYQPETTLPTERFIGAMRAGVRYLRNSPDLTSVLVRGGLFVLCGSALWALMPIVARQELGTGPAGYGTLIGFFGVGAVAGAWVLPYVKQKASADGLAACSIVLFAAVLMGLAYLRSFALLCGVMIAGGASWLALLATLNVSVQTTVPGWVRARALSLYMLVIFGGMATGSTLWGAIATRLSVPASLTFAAVGLIVGLGAALRYRLRTGEGLNLAPSRHSPAPEVVIDADPEEGPVMVTVEYRINPDRADEFIRAMRPLSRIRRRDGAIQWALFADVTDQGKHVESFICESWNEHLRYHERVTIDDRAVLTHARSFHIGQTPPKVRHFIAERLPAEQIVR